MLGQPCILVDFSEPSTSEWTGLSFRAGSALHQQCDAEQIIKVLKLQSPHQVWCYMSTWPGCRLAFGQKLSWVFLRGCFGDKSVCRLSRFSHVPTLGNPMDCSLPGSSVHGVLHVKNTGVDCHALLQGIFPTQGLNPCLSHWQADSLPPAAPGKPFVDEINMQISKADCSPACWWASPNHLKAWMARKGWDFPKGKDSSSMTALELGHWLPLKHGSPWFSGLGAQD